MQLTALACRCKEDATWGTFNSEDLELRELKVWNISLCWGDLNKLANQKHALTGLSLELVALAHREPWGKIPHTPECTALPVAHRGHWWNRPCSTLSFFLFLLTKVT